MSTENQVIIAEACGWTNCEIYTQPQTMDEPWEHAPFARGQPKPDSIWRQINFNSLDSMQQAVLAQDDEFQFTFENKLTLRTRNKVDGEDSFFHQLTVTDWQESFVETLRQLGRLK